MEHNHIQYEGRSLAAAAEATLLRAGEQWTPLRATVFRTVQRSERPSTAYDIADAISREEGRRIAPNSVYRILDLFVATNLVRKVESNNTFVVNAHPTCQHDCVFLICDRCGGVSHVDMDEVARALRASADRAGFAAKRAVIELQGTCATCAG
jgi:Fur family transcriptional regulator, zinc uptake regulator